ncbi:MAG: alanine--tRNA ligase [Oligoflexales bacterium]
MKTSEIRSEFLSYFKKNGHTVVPSSPLIPPNDPTLLFTAAGMVQFKDVFTGRETRSYTRAASAQKCLRAGGKHNDLENVGFTARHHTFFEMLGNFSFGDYFKEEAIQFAWEFVTQGLKLDKKDLHVTVYKGDDEAFKIWEKKIGIAPERIGRLGEKDNFWAMGDTGPCGPCSEIFVDRGKDVGCRKPTCALGCDCDRFLEFWNLVFMQFERNEKGEMKPLPKPSVDTGAGLERIASILQKVPTNYDTDGFQDIIRKTCDLMKISKAKMQESLVPLRVIADHSRAIAFLIADGALPSNEGRGYVLRRIIRRATRYGSKLGYDDLFLHATCRFVVDQMKDVYPELGRNSEVIEKYAMNEEGQFRRTLERGLALLDEKMAKVPKGGVLSGEDAFKLYDTFGFPLDLTMVITREKGISVDEKVFEECMGKQKTQSKDSQKVASVDNEKQQAYIQLVTELKAQKKLPSFTGYDLMAEKSSVVGIIANGQKSTTYTKSSDDDDLEIAFLKTPFYPEGGGQVADTGFLKSGTFEGKVVDCQKPLPELILLKVKPVRGSIEVGQECLQQVDIERRQLTMRNHTATHLLHWALRKVLGEHVKQAGSLVTPESLRFDFSHFEKVSPEQVQEIERLINEKIWLNSLVNKEEMEKEEAIKKGAIAFFGEKYSELVRVVAVGDYSVELCGGTHVHNISEINLFKIASESSIASGVRRIVALTSKNAFEFLDARYQESSLVRELFKATDLNDITDKINKLKDTEKALRKQLEDAQKDRIADDINRLIGNAKKLNSTSLITNVYLNDPDGVKKLRFVSEQIAKKLPNSVTILGLSESETKKSFLLAAVGDGAPRDIKANDLIKQIAELIDGKGGGNAQVAQAGGSKPEGLEAAISKATSFLQAQNH